MSEQVEVVLSTAPKEEEAVRIAKTLVDERLVACVNVVPGVRSIYRWEGQVHDDAELLMVMKTTSDKRDAVVARLKELHSYTCPEAIALPTGGGSADYLTWVREMTR
jgi:periplasmic divalent cation tolerance protein